MRKRILQIAALCFIGALVVGAANIHLYQDTANPATDGFVPTADGVGGYAWEEVILPDYPFLEVAALAQDINTAAADNEVIWNGAIVTANKMTAGGTSIAIPETGIYLVSISLVYSGLNDRYTPNISIEINGVPRPVSAQNGYIRNTQGHTSSGSTVPMQIISFTAGDTLGLDIDRAEGDANPVTLTAGESYLAVVRIL